MPHNDFQPEKQIRTTVPELPWLKGRERPSGTGGRQRIWPPEDEEKKRDFDRTIQGTKRRIKKRQKLHGERLEAQRRTSDIQNYEATGGGGWE